MCHGTLHCLQVCAPIALLYRNNKDQLVPVAIQLFQEPGSDNPVTMILFNCLSACEIKAFDFEI